MAEYTIKNAEEQWSTIGDNCDKIGDNLILFESHLRELLIELPETSGIRYRLNEAEKGIVLLNKICLELDVLIENSDGLVNIMTEIKELLGSLENNRKSLISFTNSYDYRKDTIERIIEKSDGEDRSELNQCNDTFRFNIQIVEYWYHKLFVLENLMQDSKKDNDKINAWISNFRPPQYATDEEYLGYLKDNNRETSTWFKEQPEGLNEIINSVKLLELHSIIEPATENFDLFIVHNDFLVKLKKLLESIIIVLKALNILPKDQPKLLTAKNEVGISSGGSLGDTIYEVGKKLIEVKEKIEAIPLAVNNAEEKVKELEEIDLATLHQIEHLFYNRSMLEPESTVFFENLSYCLNKELLPHIYKQLQPEKDYEKMGFENWFNLIDESVEILEIEFNKGTMTKIHEGFIEEPPTINPTKIDFELFLKFLVFGYEDKPIKSLNTWLADIALPTCGDDCNKNEGICICDEYEITWKHELDKDFLSQDEDYEYDEDNQLPEEEDILLNEKIGNDRALSFSNLLKSTITENDFNWPINNKN